MSDVLSGDDDDDDDYNDDDDDNEEKFVLNTKNMLNIMIFYATVQNDPGAHPASYTMSTGSYPGVKRPGRGIDHPHLTPRLRKE